MKINKLKGKKINEISEAKINDLNNKLTIFDKLNFFVKYSVVMKEKYEQSKK